MSHGGTVCILHTWMLQSFYAYDKVMVKVLAVAPTSACTNTSMGLQFTPGVTAFEDVQYVSIALCLGFLTLSLFFQIAPDSQMQLDH